MKLARTLVISLSIFLVAPFLLYYFLLFWVHDFDPLFLKIDACLDAGGRWDYDDGRCTR